MEGELDVVQYVRIGKFGDRPFDNDVVAKIPRQKGIECNDFD